MQNKNNFTVLCDKLVTFLWFNDNSDFSLTWLINLCKLTTIATTYLDWEQDGEPAKHSWRVSVWMYTCNTKSFSHIIYSIWPALMVQSNFWMLIELVHLFRTYSGSHCRTELCRSSQQTREELRLVWCQTPDRCT